MYSDSSTDPYYQGSFQCGRPRKGHRWSPYDRSSGELERVMADHMARNAPPGENTRQWRY
ncbi:MAG: hypothetical protein ACQERH_08060 [Acidobacteriota bacterium]